MLISIKMHDEAEINSRDAIPYNIVCGVCDFFL